MSVEAVTTDSLLDELRVLLGNRLSTSTAVREQHGKDESYHAPIAPDAARTLPDWPS